MKCLHSVLALFAAALVAGCQASGDAARANERADDASAKAASKGRPAGDGSGILHALRPDPVAIPEGTRLPIVLDTALSSGTNHAGDVVVARLTDDVRVGERVVAPAGSEVRGQVTAADASGRVKGRARLAFDFDTLVVKGKKHSIAARPVHMTAPDNHKRDAAIIGGGAGAGAIIGGIADGKKGAGIGALIGAGTGTGVVLTNKGKEVRLGSGARLTLSLTRETRL